MRIIPGSEANAPRLANGLLALDVGTEGLLLAEPVGFDDDEVGGGLVKVDGRL